MDHDDEALYSVACALAGLALLALVAGSLWVDSLWTTPVSGSPYSTIKEQSQYDAVSYGTGLLWPVIIVLSCSFATVALLLVRARKRIMLLLICISLALIIGPDIATAKTGILDAAPLHGLADWLLKGLLVSINLGALGGAWHHIFRRRPGLADR